ncbi:MAG: hypothetical protein V3U73_13915, partial [bacterium]
MDREATRRVAGRTPRITNSPGANLSQLARRVEPEGPSTWMCELNLLTPTNNINCLASVSGLVTQHPATVKSIIS